MKPTTPSPPDVTLGRRDVVRLLAGTCGALLSGCALGCVDRPGTPRGTPDWALLQTHLQGRVIPLGALDYEGSRQAMVWNAVKPDRFPDAIVRVKSETDVREAIRFARQRHLKVAVRGGGHNWHNPVLRQGGLLLDLSALNHVQVFAEQRTAVVHPGVTGAALMANLAAQGLAFPIGHSPDVRMSGFLLNGGLGWNYNVWGPSCASVEAIELVDARGESVLADRNHNAELFWAARGAGPGFFGVITRFHLKVFPFPKAIFQSTLDYRIADLDKVAAWLPQLARSVPANVDWYCLCVGSGARDGSAAWLRVAAVAFTESPAHARTALGVFETGPPGLTPSSKALYDEASAESIFGPANAPDPEPEGPRFLGESVWSNASPQALLSSVHDRILAGPATNPGVVAGLWFRHPEAAALQPDMAFSMSAPVYLWVNANSRERAHDAARQDWLRGTIASLEPLTVGRYVGEADLASAPDRPRQCFSASAWDKLIRIKQTHDPDDMFFSYLQKE